MDFGAIEDQIVAYLQSKITDPNVTIKAIPEVEEQINPKYGERQIIVAFSNEDANDAQTLSPVVQDVMVVFTMIVQGKLLRGDTGVYKLAELVKQYMIGFTPDDCQKMTYGGHKFFKNEKGIFEYTVDFKTESVRTEDVPDEVAPPFKDVTFIDVP